MKTPPLLLLLLLTIALMVSPAAALGVRWNPNPPDEGITRYELTYSTPGPNGVPMVVVKEVGPETSPAPSLPGVDPVLVVRTTVDGLIEGATYTFTVKAFNQYGESEPSDPVVYTVPKPPSKPTGLQVVEIQTSTGEVLPDGKLKWEDVAYIPLLKDGVPSQPRKLVRARLRNVGIIEEDIALATP